MQAARILLQIVHQRGRGGDGFAVAGEAGSQRLQRVRRGRDDVDRPVGAGAHGRNQPRPHYRRLAAIGRAHDRQKVVVVYVFQEPGDEAVLADCGNGRFAFPCQNAAAG